MSVCHSLFERRRHSLPKRVCSCFCQARGVSTLGTTLTKCSKGSSLCSGSNPSIALAHLPPCPSYFLEFCDSATCSFWKISGGRKGESFPPSSEHTRRCRLVGKGAGGAAGMAGFRHILPARHAEHTGQQARDQSTKQVPRTLFFGYPPSLVAVDWARSRHCSASFSIFEVSGGTVSPASREGM